MTVSDGCCARLTLEGDLRRVYSLVKEHRRSSWPGEYDFTYEPVTVLSGVEADEGDALRDGRCNHNFGTWVTAHWKGPRSGEMEAERCFYCSAPRPVPSPLLFKNGDVLVGDGEKFVGSLFRSDGKWVCSEYSDRRCKHDDERVAEQIAAGFFVSRPVGEAE